MSEEQNARTKYRVLVPRRTGLEAWWWTCEVITASSEMCRGGGVALSYAAAKEAAARHTAEFHPEAAP